MGRSILTMTKKDYELIASAFREWSYDFLVGKFTNASPKAVLETLIEEIAIKLAEENPRFDHYKFYQACGLTEEMGYAEIGKRKAG